MSAWSSSARATTMPEVFVGCGSNIEPELNLRWALGEIGRRFGGLRSSSVYRSPAHGFAGPDFLNLVVAFLGGPSADAVEAVLSELENERGRGGARRSGSRTLDLDLLTYGARIDADRRLPRGDILKYPFVLAPFAEIAPAYIHPVTGITLARAWESLAPSAPSLIRIGVLDAA